MGRGPLEQPVTERALEPSAPIASERRAFIRHPAEIPIEVRSDLRLTPYKRALGDVSVGGLSFRSAVALETGTLVHVRIAFVRPAFEADARIAWCEQRDGSFEVGVSFLGAQDRFTARMVEQLCHIERYRRETSERLGRALSGQEAAREWIHRFADSFPEV